MERLSMMYDMGLYCVDFVYVRDLTRNVIYAFASTSFIMRLSIGTTISDDVYCGSESSKA